MKTYEGFLDIFKKKYEYEQQINGYSTLLLKFERLNHIPEELLPFPENLEYINIEHNKITKIPKLNGNLKKLKCEDNELTELPELPNTLIYLECTDNEILELPKLPNGLINLYCSRNKLKELPELPSTLLVLQCHANDFQQPIKIEYMNKFFNYKDNWSYSKRNLPNETHRWLDPIYTKAQQIKFKSYEFQKEFLMNEDNNWKDLEPFGYADGIKEEFSYLFDGEDMGLL